MTKVIKYIIKDLFDLILFNLTKKYKGKEVWIFNSGPNFSGNVKHLYLYVLENRKDIRPCYITENKKTSKSVKELGGRAYSLNSSLGMFFAMNASVYVTEQFKETYPIEILKKDITLLNLWHGVGLKAIERRFKTPNQKVAQSICGKIIKYNSLFRRNTLFLTTSVFMERHFRYYCELEEEQILKAGYPRNIIEHKKKSKSSYRILKKIKQSGCKNVILYAPTFREDANFLYKAIPDVKKLMKTLESSSSLLIIKLHTRLSNDFLFQSLKDTSEKNTRLMLWDNTIDIYEILKIIDIAIIDYSSIYYDLLASGVPVFIRYIFDYDDNKKYLVYDYYENTSGLICNSFEDLLIALENINDRKEENDNGLELYNKFWSYSVKNNCDLIIKEARAFSPLDIKMKNFYSFDVFDTLLSRKVLEPKAIFLFVMTKMKTSTLEFPDEFYHSYNIIRSESERNAREEISERGMKKEIKFDEIFEKMSSVYNLTENQIDWLKKTEIEAELLNVLPNKDYINICESLIHEGETVVLISDMYLPKEVIKQLISQVSVTIAGIPLFVSSEVGYQKITSQLYVHVFKEFSPWPFEKWIHYGDNKFADGEQARILGIETIIHAATKFNNFERKVVECNPSYDGYLLAGMLAHNRAIRNLSNKEYFSFAHLSSYIVPYIHWVVNDAVKKDVKTLYFISRDGFLLKKVADKIIELRGIQLKTKYIYGSRKVWRLSSQIDSLDEEFFGMFGNFSGIKTYEDLLQSIRMTDEQFQKYFPELKKKYNKSKKIKQVHQLRKYLSTSKHLAQHLLKVAKTDRELVCGYLKNEINSDERFAFVEYWARGYTQTCLCKLLSHIRHESVITPFYYYRSIYKSEKNCPRYNYTSKNTSVLFVEAIFSNNPFKSLSKYKFENGSVYPQLVPQYYNKEILDSNIKYLTDFIDRFEMLSVAGDRDLVLKKFSSAGFDYYEENPLDPSIYQTFKSLKFNDAMYAASSEFAPKFNIKMLYHFLMGHKMQKYTMSIPISIERSNIIYKSLLKMFCNK